jgi:hypothetical protein
VTRQPTGTNVEALGGTVEVTARFGKEQLVLVLVGGDG